jgi:hypothetical protein
MHDQELLRRAHYDQDNGPPDDLYVIPELTPRQQARERSITSLRSHDISGQSYTLGLQTGH